MQHDFILLDRSGSMEENNRWTEALSGINAYVAKLATDNVDTGVTLAIFDQQGGLRFDVIRDRITPPTWKPVTSKDAHPRGGTPLSDAVGRIVGLANEGFGGVQYEKVAIIIVTDGHENASKELSREQAKKLLDDCRAKGWQVVFLSSDFDNAAQGRDYGATPDMVVAMASANSVNTMERTATMRSAYGLHGTQMSYTEEDKKAALEQ